MTEQELKELLYEFRKLPAETEWIEFKEAKNQFDFNKLGKYFSALSNEANLKDKRYAWLIFGINDRSREISGTNYRLDRRNLDSLKYEIAQRTINNITFMDIFELDLDEGRVIMFQIPAAPRGIPVSWNGHYYGRHASSLVPLNIQEIDQIRSQVIKDDWSAKICHDATLDDLDNDAIEKARKEYMKKNPKLVVEVANWDDTTFLDKAKLTINGKITRTAIILLGKEGSEHHLRPSVAKMTWILKDNNNIEQDYEHYGPPFILNVDKVYNNIRNLKYRYLTENTLFPNEITKYEPYVIRETLHNCIVHQDYTLNSRINIVETPNCLTFTNAGSFIPKSVENVIDQDAPQEYYRNEFLATAMVNLNMIDTIGSGIKKMFLLQMQRYFPLPDYDLSQPERVKVRILGEIIDENYTRLLMKKIPLDLKTVMYLDKVQKMLPITREEYRLLKDQDLVEGRYPNIYVVSQVAAVTGEKAKYIRNRGFDKNFYKKLILGFIDEYGSATRKDIDELIIDKLPDILDEKQKKKKVSNILSEMAKKDQTIVNNGSNTKPKWVRR